MAEDPVGDLGFDFGTVSIAASIAAMALLQMTWGGMDDPEAFERMGAWGMSVAHQPWRLVSYAWLHGGAEHLVANLLALAVFGWPLERAIGWRRLFLLYLAAVVGGSMLSAVLEQPLWLVGASAGIFGLYGAMASLAVHPRHMLHAGEVAVLREAVWPIGLVLVLQSFQPGTSWAGHLGGLAVGVVAGASGLLVRGLAARAPESDVMPVAWGRALVATVLVGILACGCGPVMLALVVAYAVIVGLVAAVEPRYSAADGWATTLAAMAAAAVLWGSAGLAFALGRPWEIGGVDLAPIEAPASPVGVEVRDGLR